MLISALKSTSIVKKTAAAEAAIIIKKAEQRPAELGEFAKTEITALTESAEVLVKTAEGFEIAIDAKRANIAKETQALHSGANAFNKTKNGLKSESVSIGASKAYPNGKYVNNPKHHKNSRGNINKPPINGQKALDESIAGPCKEYRIGIENGKIVQFNQYAPNEYHGFIVKDFNKLHQEAKNALYEA